MKKLALLLIVSLMTFVSCQRSKTEPVPVTVTETVATKAEASAFVKEASAKTTAAGWKYFTIKTGYTCLQEKLK